MDLIHTSHPNLKSKLFIFLQPLPPLPTIFFEGIQMEGNTFIQPNPSLSPLVEVVMVANHIQAPTAFSGNEQPPHAPMNHFIISPLMDPSYRYPFHSTTLPSTFISPFHGVSTHGVSTMVNPIGVRPLANFLYPSLINTIPQPYMINHEPNSFGFTGIGVTSEFQSNPTLHNLNHTLQMTPQGINVGLYPSYPNLLQPREHVETFKKRNRSYTCKICRVEFPTSQAYGGHMSYHSKEDKKARAAAEANLKESNRAKIQKIDNSFVVPEAGHCVDMKASKMPPSVLTINNGFQWNKSKDE